MICMYTKLRFLVVVDLSALTLCCCVKISTLWRAVLCRRRQSLDVPWLFSAVAAANLPGPLSFCATVLSCCLVDLSPLTLCSRHDAQSVCRWFSAVVDISLVRYAAGYCSTWSVDINWTNVTRSTPYIRQSWIRMFPQFLSRLPTQPPRAVLALSSRILCRR